MDANIEEQKPQMLKPAMNYGLFYGIILVAYTVLMWVLNMMMTEFVGYINYLVMIFCTFFFTKKFRDDYFGGFITYGQAIKFNALMLVFVSFIVAFYSYIFYRFIEPGMIEKLLEKTREVMVEKNGDLTEEQIDIAISMQKKFMTPLMMFFSTIVGTYFFGIVFALITSIFVQKKDKSIDESLLQ